MIPIKALETTVPGQYTVTLYQTSKTRFRVVYGLQQRAGLSYVDAAKEYGLCILHALTCAGTIEEPVS